MWLNQDFTCIFTHICYFYSGSTIHIYPLISISRTTQKYSTPNPGENSQKYFYFFLWNKCSSYLVTTTCYIISWDECSKKKGEKKNIRGNKKGQVPETSKEKKKSETRGKNGQVSDSRIRGTWYPPERKEKWKIEHPILLIKFQKARKVCIPSKEQK